MEDLVNIDCDSQCLERFHSVLCAKKNEGLNYVKRSKKTSAWQRVRILTAMKRTRQRKCHRWPLVAHLYLSAFSFSVFHEYRGF